jgi:hypothetical protein
MASGAVSLLYVSAKSLALVPAAWRPLEIAIYVFYSIAAALALGSFADYFIQYRKLTSPRP